MTPTPTSPTGRPERLIVRTRTSVLAQLRHRIAGEVLGPGDAGFREARAGFNRLVIHRPSVIAIPANHFDVVEAVRFAAEEDLRVTVQATGHGTGVPADGGLLINTSRLTSVAVDPIARTARVAAGATWKMVLDAAVPYGLAPLMGSASIVGAVGYTLGGGFGWLGRRFGLGSDAVRAFDLVTPDGTPIRVSDASFPHIFWALKGGGAGSLGVVTSMEIALADVATVYAGNLFYPVAEAEEIMRRFRDWAPAQREELTSAVTILNLPPTDDVPEPLRGGSFAVLRGCWSGDTAAGRAIVDEWRDWRTPLVDLWDEMPFAAADAISMDPTEPMPVMVTTEWFDDLQDEAIDVIAGRSRPAPGSAPLIVSAEIRHAGGAIARGAARAANDRARSGRFLLELISIVPDPHVALAVESTLRVTRTELAPYVTGATYLNFTSGAERAGRAAESYSVEHRRRLLEIKATLDPHDRFCHGDIV
ncbi:MULTISPECIES: FAD-binding oxidoreductase [Gordonia]|uniref:FAD-binding oxidoreductase n=1 Tax=Gordonia amicalis TaxID=89053 RepID=A0AAE4R9V1_9ACTN|nr:MULTISPECIES: FAD-binding oxidoreductase [Gordonia]ATD71212.1 FAD-binding oxidoreductase [Gordonia sp. 1D]KAF0967665.1 Mitomycin radical oxidase [Gordonia sp. YY1]MCZ4579760.1 FAD-binding oxidoreductase [Gordonia amicalis]MDJ0453446.1 FAD-binding oxidoreductase [Gordonia amicalis]MDV6308303.1 FAD-binding oxidoreductase [Gordonia amicalis]